MARALSIKVLICTAVVVLSVIMVVFSFLLLSATWVCGIRSRSRQDCREGETGDSVKSMGKHAALGA